MIQYISLSILLLQFLYYNKIFNLHKFGTTMLALIILASVGGFSLTHSNPKFIYWSEFDIKFSGILLKIGDILFHHLPLIYFIYYHQNNKFNKDNMILFFFLATIYLLLYDPIKIYFINKKQMLFVLISSILLVTLANKII